MNRWTLYLGLILVPVISFWLFTGTRDKFQVLKQALAPGPPEEMPVRFVLRQADLMEVFWAR